MRPLLAALIVVLLCALVDARGLHAQARPDDALRARRAAVASTAEATEGARRREAVRWASERGVPLGGRGVLGRPVALVGVDGLRPLYLTVHNREAAEATGTLDLHPGERLGLGLTGRGLTLGVWDAAHVLGAHREFGGRVEAGDAAGTDDHATHVAGTLAAGGVDARARGMAPEARLRSFDWVGDVTEMMGEAARGLLVSNHSYGAIAGWYYGDLDGVTGWYWFGDPTVSDVEDHAFGWYGTEAAQYDRAVYAYPTFLPVVAAGNDREDLPPGSGTYRALDAAGTWRTYDARSAPRPRDGGVDGYDTIAGAAVAKNVLTVGSIGLDGSAPRVSGYSAFGPTDDGRVKPDLVGYGERVYSALADGDDRYGVLSGTSMAAPNVAGSLLLLQEYALALRGAPLSAAALKALALHTARDLGRPGPDYAYGWGLLDAAAAAEHLAAAPANPVAVLEAELENGRTFTRRTTVDAGGPLRVTLAWTDPPSARLPVRGPASLDDPTPHLRHDLDLAVVHEPSGTVYRPWTLDPRTPDAPAVPGDNRVDPVEQVFVADAPPGTYVVRVTHKGGFEAPVQPFALVTSGAREAVRAVAVAGLAARPEADAVALAWRTVFERAGGTLRVERADVHYGADGTRRVAEPAVVGERALRGVSEAGHAYDFRDDGLLAGRYLYRLVYADGLVEEVLGEAEVLVAPPDALAVLSSYPNPFVDAATVVLDLPERQRVTVEVYDLLGRRLARLVDEVLGAGRHRLALDGSAWAPGTYVVRVVTPRGPLAHRVVKAR